MSQSVWVIILCLSVMTILTRALPFMLAHLMTDRINFIGKFLPAYIMLLLVIYEIKPNQFFHAPYALPELLSLAYVVLIHLWFRNSILSILTGTGFYLTTMYICWFC